MAILRAVFLIVFSFSLIFTRFQLLTNVKEFSLAYRKCLVAGRLVVSPIQEEPILPWVAYQNAVIDVASAELMGEKNFHFSY